jgi:hypothetical protein
MITKYDAFLQSINENNNISESLIDGFDDEVLINI